MRISHPGHKIDELAGAVHRSRGPMWRVARWHEPKNRAKSRQTAPLAIVHLRLPGPKAHPRRGTNVALVPPPKSATFRDIRDICSTPSTPPTAKTAKNVQFRSKRSRFNCSTDLLLDCSGSPRRTRGTFRRIWHKNRERQKCHLSHASKSVTLCSIL